MTSPELENLVRIGQLKREPPAAGEVDGLRRSGEARLADAGKRDLSAESRFDLAYNAAHALALAALRRLGYRPDNRYIVFQALAHTLGLKPAIWRVLAKGHENRNLAEYQGGLEIDERLVADMVDAALTASDKPIVEGREGRPRGRGQRRWLPGSWRSGPASRWPARHW